MSLILDSQPTSRTIPVGYLSAEGKAAVAARAEELRQYLLRRRALRLMTIALSRMRVVAAEPRDLGPVFADSVRGDLYVVGQA